MISQRYKESPAGMREGELSVGRWYLTRALKDNRKKRIQGGPSGVDHRNDGRKLGLGMPRSSENGRVYRECCGGWGLWEMRREASAERQGR